MGDDEIPAEANALHEKARRLGAAGDYEAAIDALEREGRGDLPEGTYAAYMSLEWISDPTQKAGIVSQMVEKFPTFAPVWKEFALQCEGSAEKLAAIERGLAAKPDRETKGILLINKALTLHEQGDARAAKSILGELALDPDTTFANEHLAKQVLVMVNQ